MIRSRFAARAAGFAAAAVPFLFLAGCGGGSGTYTTGGVPLPTPSPSPSPSGQRFFASTFATGGGQTVTVNATAQSGGAVSGTVSVNDGRATRAIVGTGSITGTLNFSTGAVSLNGSYTQNGVTTPISVTGTVPGTGGTGGTSTLSLGESQYNAQWVVSTTGPIDSNGNNGGNASGGSSALAFTGNSSNITASNLNAAAGVAVRQTIPFVGDILTVTAADVVSGKPRTVTIAFTAVAPVAGSSYDLSSSDDVKVAYSEGTTTLKAFESTGGTVQVTGVTGNKFTFKLTGVTMTALSGSPISTGTGAFTIDGTITATVP